MPTLSVDRLDHLVLVVRDMDATCAFYRHVLGIEVETFGRGRTALRVGRQKINLEPARGLPSDRPTAGASHLCFVTGAPLAEWIAHLATRGVPLIEGPVKRSGAIFLGEHLEGDTAQCTRSTSKISLRVSRPSLPKTPSQRKGRS